MKSSFIRSSGRTAVVIITILFLLTGCNPREMLMKKIISEQENYLAPEDAKGSEFKKLTSRVYTFRWTWYRNIVIDTDEGLVIVDPINEIAAKQLQEFLKRELPGRPVHTIIYSHYHLDHATGGAVFNARNLIAHEKCPQYWDDIHARDVAKPTMLVSGNKTLEIGNVRIELLYLGRSHTDTLYAVYLPQEDLLFTTDFCLIRTIPPLGGPDYYIPGALKAAERLSALKFSVYVPSHFGYGTKEDFLEAVEFMRYFRKLCREAVEKYGIAGGAALPDNSTDLRKMFEHIYYPMKERYGDWHGFDEMILMAAIRHIVGEALGY